MFFLTISLNLWHFVTLSWSFNYVKGNQLKEAF